MGFTPIDESEIAASAPSYPGFTPISDEDIAYTPTTSPTHMAAQENSGVITDAASGFLGGVAGLGDIVDIPSKLMDATAGRAFDYLLGREHESKPGIGDYLRQGADAVTGVEGSTSLNPDSLAHKFGSYLPTTILAGPEAVSSGASDLATYAAKVLGLNSYLSGAGYVGNKVAGPAGELVATLGAASAPMAAKGIYNAAVHIPTEEEALLKAFKVPETQVDKVGPALQSLKDQGIVVAPGSDTPFADIKGNLDSAVTQSQAAITKALDGTSTTIADIWPDSATLGSKTMSGEESKAALGALRSEQDNLVKLALVKKYPPPTGVDPIEHGDSLLKQYKGFQSAAKAGDRNAKSAVKMLDDIIDQTDISGKDLWQLRQGYDSGAKWNGIDPKGKAVAYRAMRDAAQQNLLRLAPDTAPLFEDFSAQMKGLKPIEKLAGAEKKGTTQSPPFLQAAVGNTLKSLLAKTTGWGHVPAVKPETSLQAAFSTPLISRLLNAIQPPKAVVPTLAGKGVGNLMPQEVPKNMDKIPPVVFDEIKKDPIDHAIMLMESGGDPGAKNKNSTASGLFQLLKKTASNLNVKDVFDPAQNYEGYKKLRAENAKLTGDNPVKVYAAHYLGAPVFKKLMEGDPLTPEEKAQVNYLKETILPKFLKIYNGLAKSDIVSV